VTFSSKAGLKGYILEVLLPVSEILWDMASSKNRKLPFPLDMPVLNFLVSGPMNCVNVPW
jgi:hypothetical protein